MISVFYRLVRSFVAGGLNSFRMGAGQEKRPSQDQGVRGFDISAQTNRER